MSLWSGSYKGSSFFDLLRHDFPHMLPLQHLPQIPAGESRLLETVPFATTILALRFADGVVMAGDRQATEGFEVSSRRIEKLYNADSHSVVAMAGVAGPCLDMAKLFQIEMEHYEKIEGAPLALEGKANRLGTDGQAEPAGRFSGAGRGADFRRLRCPRRAGPHLQVRRDRRAATRNASSTPPAPGEKRPAAPCASCTRIVCHAPRRLPWHSKPWWMPPT